MNGWPTSPLCKVATIDRKSIQPEDIRSGTTYIGLEHIESGGKILGTAEVEAGELGSSKFQFTDRHVLYGKLRPYLSKIARPDFSGICSTDILPIMPGPVLERDFLLHFLRQPSMVKHATARSSGANLPRLSPTALKEFEVPLPPLPEQKRIAAILDKADELRAKRRAALAELDTLVQSIFLEMFGDPVVNRKGWPVVQLGEVVKVKGGYAFKSKDFAPAGKAVVRISNLDGMGIDLSGVARIPDEVLGKGVNYKIYPGDILMAMSGATTGKMGVVPVDFDEELYQNQRVGNFRIQSHSRILREYLLGLLRSEFYQKFLWQLAWGAAQPNVSSRQLESAQSILPPIDLQSEYARRVGKIKQIEANEQASLAEHDALFASLQHRAFRGEL